MNAYVAAPVETLPARAAPRRCEPRRDGPTSVSSAPISQPQHPSSGRRLPRAHLTSDWCPPQFGSPAMPLSVPQTRQMSPVSVHGSSAVRRERCMGALERGAGPACASTCMVATQRCASDQHPQPGCRHHLVASRECVLLLPLRTTVLYGRRERQVHDRTAVAGIDDGMQLHALRGAMVQRGSRGTVVMSRTGTETRSSTAGHDMAAISGLRTALPATRCTHKTPVPP